MKYIYNILSANKRSLLLIYFYMLLAQLLFLVGPYVLGKTIDGLLHNQYNWLYCFLGIELLANVFIYKRMIYDTKVYTKIYNGLIFDYLKSDKESSTSSKIARTEMAHSIINFLENDIQYYIMSVITIFGSLGFIFLEHTLTGFIVLFCAIPISFIVYWFWKKIAQGTRVGHNIYETKANILSSEDDDRIKSFYKRRAKIIISQSTIQGKNWVSLNTTKTIFLVLALFVFTSNNFGLTQGQAIAMFTYINQFLISLMSIPVGMETFTRIKDVLSRIKAPLSN